MDGKWKSTPSRHGGNDVKEARPEGFGTRVHERSILTIVDDNEDDGKQREYD